MFVKVFIDRSLPQIDQLYTYRVPEDLEEEVSKGKRVIVPFGRGNSKITAIVIEIFLNLDHEIEVKNIIQIMDTNPVLSPQAIHVGQYIRERYLVDYAQAFRPFLPGKAIGEIEEKYILIQGSSNKELEELFNRKDYICSSDVTEEEKKIIRQGHKLGQIKIEFSLKEAIKKRKTSYYMILDNTEINLSNKQKLVFDFLKKNGPKSKKEILKELQISSSPLESLLKKGIVNKIFIEDFTEKVIESRPKFSLNEEQNKVINEISKSKERVHLLFGVTGSGKTEVYMELVKKTIREGKSAIILVPEISLTPQTIERFKNRFGNIISVLHSRLSQGERAEEWINIQKRKNKIVIGARSAIFAPVSDLGLIIIDEEQEGSYEYHNSLRYATGDVAEKLVEVFQGKLIYGSATPSVETFYRSNKLGEIKMHKLKHRANPYANLPDIEIIDMREELEKGNTSIFSEKLLNTLNENYIRGNQSILFINRRGHSNFVSCRSCGYVIKCDNCDISMTFHKNIHRLRCHYCGETKNIPTECPECGSIYIKKFGVGTEQVEDEAKKYFPNANIVRMDRDTMNEKDSYSKIYEKMKKREIDILVGTQMLAKGFDFDKLTFVGIIAADTSLNLPDYKSQERTFQLLTQVAGRAGRSVTQGKVILQTYSPENYSIVYAQKNDYEEFYQKEIEQRKFYFYPPFSRIMKLQISSTFEKKAEMVALKWKKTFIQMNEFLKLDMEILGPISLPKIKNYYHFEVGAKIRPEQYTLLLKEMKRVLFNYYRHLKEENIKISIDIS